MAEQWMRDLVLWLQGELTLQETKELFSALVKNGEAFDLGPTVETAVRSYMSSGMLEESGEPVSEEERMRRWFP